MLSVLSVGKMVEVVDNMGFDTLHHQASYPYSINLFLYNISKSCEILEGDNMCLHLINLGSSLSLKETYWQHLDHMMSSIT